MKRRVPESMGQVFALIENGILAEPWVLGDAYSSCDSYLFSASRWLERDGVDLTRLPRVLAHRARMLERPAVQRVLQLHGG
jgi:glutathione S-transferase